MAQQLNPLASEDPEVEHSHGLIVQGLSPRSSGLVAQPDK